MISDTQLSSSDRPSAGVTDQKVRKSLVLNRVAWDEGDNKKTTSDQKAEQTNPAIATNNINGADVGSVGRSSGRRLVAKFYCCVPECRNDELTIKADGAPVQFFDLPTGRARKLWMCNIPEMRFAISPAQRKVCEMHFVDGRPTEEHPSPEMKLGPLQSFGRKRKSLTPDNNAMIPAGGKLRRRTAAMANGHETNNNQVTALIRKGTPNANANLSRTDAEQQVVNVVHKENDGANAMVIPTSNIQQTKTKAKTRKVRVIPVVPRAVANVSSTPGKLSSALDTSISPALTCADDRPTLTDQSSAAAIVSGQDPSCKQPEEDGQPCSSSAISSTGSKMTLADVLASMHSADSACPVTDVPSNSINPACAVEPLVAVQNHKFRNNPNMHNTTICQNCSSELPTIRLGLGQLESRLESVISMVRTMYKMSTVSAQEQNSSWTAAMSQQGNSSTATSGATTAKTVTVLRTGGPKSATSKAATNSKSIRVIKISKLVAQSKKVMDMDSGLAAKDDVPSAVVQAEQVINGQHTVSSAKIDNDASGDEDSDRESGRLMIDEGSSPMGNSPKKKKKKTPRSAKAKSVGKDSVPSVIVTKERAVPKPYLVKPIARALLLFPGSAYTIGDFMKNCPLFLKNHLDKLDPVVSKLVEQGLLRPIDDNLSATDNEQAYEKERDRAKLAKLSEYTIDINSYTNSFERL